MQKLGSVTSSSSRGVHPITVRRHHRPTLESPTEREVWKLCGVWVQNIWPKPTPLLCSWENRFSWVPAVYLKYNTYGWRCCCYDCASVLNAMSQKKQVIVVVSLIWDVKTERFAGLTSVSISQRSRYRNECSDLSLFRLPPPQGWLVWCPVRIVP